MNNDFGLLRKKKDLVEFEQFAQKKKKKIWCFFSFAHPKVGLLFVMVKPSLMYSLACTEILGQSFNFFFTE